MAVQTCVGMTVGGSLAAWDVKTITRGKTVGDVAYVSSLTAGRTFRVPGNQDRTWEITLLAKTGEYEIPAALSPGVNITLQTPAAGLSEKMLVQSASLEIDIATDSVIGFSLSCAAVDVDSYV